MHRSIQCFSLAAAFGAILLTPNAELMATERMAAEVTCQSTEKDLVYDCMIALTGRKSGTPVEEAAITVSADMPSMPMAHNVRPVTAKPASKPGMYQATIELEMYGEWALTLDIKEPSRDRVIRKLHFGGAAAGHGKTAHGGHGQMAHGSSGGLSVLIHRISADGVGDMIGKIVLKDGDHGLMVMPDLAGLAPGKHGFHVHEHGDCGPADKDGKLVAGLAAGGHYGHGSHGGSHGSSHSGSHDKPVGDLPELVVAADGTATEAVTNHHLKAAEVAGRSIMIHGESSSPDSALRVACGVIPKMKM